MSYLSKLGTEYSTLSSVWTANQHQCLNREPAPVFEQGTSIPLAMLS